MLKIFKIIVNYKPTNTVHLLKHKYTMINVLISKPTIQKMWRLIRFKRFNWHAALVTTIIMWLLLASDY